MRILLLGVTGQVGWELARTLPLLGELVTTSRSGTSSLHLDTGDLKQLQTTLDTVNPDVIVNATAYTAVDRAESEPAQTMLLNADVPGLIGAWAARHRALVIHYSTDYVFDGSKQGAYDEHDPVNPLNVYGRSKLAGDQALLASGCDSLILRVSWVYSLRGHNFLLTMLRLMRERRELRVVDDQIGAPTWSRTIAQASALMLAKLPADPAARQALSGIYHLAPAGQTSGFGFASAIRDHQQLDCTLQPITTSEYPTPARRPLNSLMNAGHLEETFGLRAAPWSQDLALCLDTGI